MLSINNGFLGNSPICDSVKFHGSDNKKVFENNLRIKPDDWYYRTHDITYSHNSNGHRCKEITDIDLDNYILFAGCSHTEGVGLELEKTYPYLLSKKMKCDYYNLALGGTGIDVLNYNIVTWFSKIKKLPKLLVVQWQRESRVIIKDFSNNGDTNKWHTHGAWTASNDKSVGNFLTYGKSINFFKTSHLLAKNSIHNLANCPIIELNVHRLGTPVIQFEGELTLEQIDSARDVSGHLGINSQLKNSEMLYNETAKLILGKISP
jgi:hypothetical protein